jgi:hypothetical protein
MGIPRGSARLLIEEAKARPFEGSVLQLGRSSLYFTEAQFEGWARDQDFEPKPAESALSHDPRLATQGCMSDVTFFRRLGFDDVYSSDIAEWEGADFIFDLNEPIPDELEGRFDVVFETGTIVQIFHLPNVLANLHRLVKPGGRIVHCAVPSNNHMDLGFYMLSPSFFADYYTANRYRIESHYLCEYYAWWHDGRLHSGPWDVYRYEPGCLDALSYGRYGSAQAASFVVATRTEESTGDVIPQLGQYRRSWQRFESAEAGAVAGALQDETPRSPWLTRATLPLKRVAETVRRRLLPRPMPPRVGRF